MKLSNLLILYYCKKSDNELVKILNKEFKKVFIANSIKEATISYKKYSPCIVLLDDDLIKEYITANINLLVDEIKEQVYDKIY